MPIGNAIAHVNRMVNERQHDGQDQPVADHGRDRQVEFERVAEVADEEAGDPAQVLLPQRLVEAVLLAQERDLLRIDRFALRLQLGDVALEVVARRQLDDDEHDDADRDQRRDHDQQAADDVGEHRGLRSRCRYACPRPASCRLSARIQRLQRSNVTAVLDAFAVRRRSRTRFHRSRTYPGDRCRSTRPDPSCTAPWPARCAVRRARRPAGGCR